METTATKIKEQIEQKLQDQQKSKLFRDVGRVAQTRKEKSAYKLISGQLLNTIEEDAVMAFNMVKKENVWPEIDVAELRNKGNTAGAAYLKVKIREAVPTRPKDEKAKRATYVLFLERLQLELLDCYTVAQIRALTEKYRNLPIADVIGYFLNPEFLTASEERKREIQEQLKTNQNIRLAFMYSGSMLVSKLINEVFGSRFENTFFKKSDAASILWEEAKSKEPITAEESAELITALHDRKQKFVAANEEIKEKYKNYTPAQLLVSLNTDWQINPESKKIYKADIESFRTWVLSYYDRRIRNEVARWEEKEKTLQPRDNDWSWTEKKEVTASTKPKAEAINTKTPLDFIKRTGGYKIETNTPQEIIDKFGFSAVNYGVYVDDAWSKEHTKHFLGAMSDLGQTLNLNIAQVNKLGELSIAFGAKGRKGHAATYFPQTKDINLTRGNGDGSVAHEWGHYFDNVIVERAEQKATNSFASENASQDYDIKILFKELMDFYYRGNPLYTPKIPMRFYAKKRDEAPTYSVRDGYGWVSKAIELKDTIEETLEQVSSWQIVNKDYHSTQVRIFGWIVDQFGLEEYDVPMTLRTSYVYHKSAYNAFVYCYTDENGKLTIGADTRTKYWTSAPELFARAWESVVQKKILAQGKVSNYLVNGIPTDDIISESYFAPYPTGSELNYIETIIDRIILAVKKKYNIGDFVPPSIIVEDEFLDLTKTGKVEAGVVVEENLVTGEETVDFVGAIATLELLLESDPENSEWIEAISTLKLLSE
jgi:hypothetical protein